MRGFFPTQKRFATLLKTIPKQHMRSFCFSASRAAAHPRTHKFHVAVVDKRQLSSITKELEAPAIVSKTQLILIHRPQEQHADPVTSPGFGSALQSRAAHEPKHCQTWVSSPKNTAQGPKTPFQCFSHSESSQMRKQAAKWFAESTSVCSEEASPGSKSSPRRQGEAANVNRRHWKGRRQPSSCISPA